MTNKHKPLTLYGKGWKALDTPNPTDEISIECEVLASIHMTLQQARDDILRKAELDSFDQFAISQIERDIAAIERLF